MKILSVIKKILYSSTFTFTVTMFAFMGIFELFYNDLELTSTKAVPLSHYPWILLFSLVVGILNNLLTSKLFNIYLRVAIHFAGIMGAIYLIFMQVFGLGQNSSGKLAVMAVIAILYAIVMLVSFALRKGFFALAGKMGATAAAGESKKKKDKKKAGKGEDSTKAESMFSDEE